eukprot:scaffold1720_cov353-Pavlova_lutheri.AAC.9
MHAEDRSSPPQAQSGTIPGSRYFRTWHSQGRPGNFHPMVSLPPTPPDPERGALDVRKAYRGRLPMPPFDPWDAGEKERKHVKAPSTKREARAGGEHGQGERDRQAHLRRRVRIRGGLRSCVRQQHDPKHVELPGRVHGNRKRGSALPRNLRTSAGKGVPVLLLQTAVQQVDRSHSRVPYSTRRSTGTTHGGEFPGYLNTSGRKRGLVKRNKHQCCPLVTHPTCKQINQPSARALDSWSSANSSWGSCSRSR